jgi:hypothetical protein
MTRCIRARDCTCHLCSLERSAHYEDPLTRLTPFRGKAHGKAEQAYLEMEDRVTKWEPPATD